MAAHQPDTASNDRLTVRQCCAYTQGRRWIISEFPNFYLRVGEWDRAKAVMVEGAGIHASPGGGHHTFVVLSLF